MNTCHFLSQSHIKSATKSWKNKTFLYFETGNRAKVKQELRVERRMFEIRTVYVLVSNCGAWINSGTVFYKINLGSPFLVHTDTTCDPCQMSDEEGGRGRGREAKLL